VKHNIPALAIGDKNKIRSKVYKHRDETGEIGDGEQEKTNNNIRTPMLPPPPTLRTDNNRPVVAARQINAVHGEVEEKRKKWGKELCAYLGQNR
jgi:hypothetical protein